MIHEIGSSCREAVNLYIVLYQAATSAGTLNYVILVTEKLENDGQDTFAVWMLDESR